MIALKNCKIDFFFAYKIALSRMEVDVQERFLYSKKNYEKNVHNEDYSNQICSIHKILCIKFVAYIQNKILYINTMLRKQITKSSPCKL
jgi:hypothetical protein